MPGFTSLREYTNAFEQGAEKFATWRKQPAVVTVAGVWTDLSMSPGLPTPQYYTSVALQATVMGRTQTPGGGLPHGGDVSPLRKFLHRLVLVPGSGTGLPANFVLCDYLLYYPFVDEGELEPQELNNTLATLPRYTDGEGVKIMAVVVAPHVAGGQTFNVTYTNSHGVGGRTTVNAPMCPTQFVNGTLISSAAATANSKGPFLTLQAGDTGVRSIEWVTVNGTGDVGLFTLVLVKPLATVTLRGVDAPVEVEFIRMQGGNVPRITDNAYLNFICTPAGSLSGVPIHGIIHTIWG